MESKCLAMLVLVFLMLGAVGWCEGCLEEESVALSQLKPFFPFIDYTVAVERPRLDYHFDEDYDSSVEEDYYSVEEKESSLDCCKWDRVECNPTTGRVIKLFLPFPTRRNDFFRDHWYLNASLFLPFEELKNLSLSGNRIAGCVADQGFERLSSRLNKLEILDLSFNYFNDTILASISELSSLKSLILRGNEIMTLNHNNGIKMLSKLNNLEVLDLSSNFLEALNFQNLGFETTVNLMGKFYVKDSRA
ncbi:hypothetical protein HRI_001784300 [Hibiscus trionum]|uniref:Leucine-rich repeat-containing N-terminal plant-type domain-containing protein n=1 Tax=Hibiscus trionum TaxID=183268 RepID=A0A9W7HNI4_HIBTR|nr:hypothetical protein HRI_001784300 [Hibiscus trionum]